MVIKVFKQFLYSVLRSPEKSKCYFLQIVIADLFYTILLPIYALELQKEGLVPHKNFFQGRNYAIGSVAILYGHIVITELFHDFCYIVE